MIRSDLLPCGCDIELLDSIYLPRFFLFLYWGVHLHPALATSSAGLVVIPSENDPYFIIGRVPDSGISLFGRRDLLWDLPIFRHHVTSLVTSRDTQLSVC